MDTTVDTEISSNTVSSERTSKAHIEFLVKENNRLEEEINQLKNDQIQKKKEYQAKVSHLSNIHLITMNQIKEKVKNKLTEYLTEISSLHNERLRLISLLKNRSKELYTLSKAHEELMKRDKNETEIIQNVFKGLQNKDEKLQLSTILTNYKESITKLSGFYSTQLKATQNMLNASRLKIQEVQAISKKKELVIDQFSSRLNAAICSITSQDDVGDDKFGVLRREYIVLRRKHQLLMKSYEILGNKFETTSQELVKYQNITSNKHGDIIKALQNSLAEKQNRLELLYISNEKLKREGLQKAKMIRMLTKSKEGNKSLLTPSNLKVVLYQSLKSSKKINDQ